MAGEISADRVAGLVKFIQVCGQLKQEKRTGWVRRGVNGPESVADHSYRMAMMAFAMAPEAGVDANYCVNMGLVHDLAEAIVGDLVIEGEDHNRDPITKEEKAAKEEAAMESICKLIGMEGDKALKLWREYEAQETKEARFMKDLDKLEMLCQAREYEEMQGEELTDFYKSTEGKIKSPICAAVDKEIRAQKAKWDENRAKQQ